MEMEQLLSMGFPNELAAQALAATGGKSTLKATEWILTRNNKSTPNPNPNPNPNPSSSQSQQPKLDHFFHFQSSRPSSSDSPPLRSPATAQIFEKRLHYNNSDHGGEAAADSDSSLPHRKRPKILPHEPLSERMRPLTIDDVIGQDHLLSNKNSLIRSAVERNRLPSLIFWGPPGTGKTSMAKAIANSINSFASSSCCYRFVSLSAVTSGVKDVRDAVDDARKMMKSNSFTSKRRTVLFVDEVHRFNKSQQDSFLPVIEDGSIVFMGATTENPSFHLITPLLSRCRVLTLNPLKPHHLSTLLKRAVDDSEKGLSQSVGMKVEVDEEAIEFLSTNADGDARVALNALEISATTATARVPSKQFGGSITQDGDDNNDDNTKNPTVTLDDVKEALQCKHLAYDKAGDEHYNLISALHKSMRGSDSNAAIYWLARMLEGGEEPLYIARRLIRFASEDVGLADPSALTQAIACYQACHFLGMPECNVNLAQCVAYLALASKSVAVYKAIEAAQKVVRESVGQNEGVPLHLRNAPTKLMKELGYNKGYIYPPDNPSSSSQSYLPLSLQCYKFLDWPNHNANDK